MPTFRPLAESTDAPTLALFREVLMKYHSDFVKYKALIRLFFASATRDRKTGEPKGPAIRADRNHAAAYKSEAHQHAARVKGSADASITLDGDEWDHFPESRQRAVLDEALRELELVWTKEGDTVDLDDQGRPKMRKATPDVTVRVWYDVAERGGDVASAVLALRSLRRPFVQLVFDFTPAERDPPAERQDGPRGTTTVTFTAEMGRNAKVLRELAETVTAEVMG